MDDLEVKRLVAALEAHGQFEMDRDVDGTMSTVAANPHYEFVTVGWQITGRDAIREMYRRMFADANNKVLSAEKRTVAAAENTLCMESFYVRERADGTQYTCQSTAMVLFEGDLVAGERLYSDVHQAQVLREAFGDDFGEVPGVSRL